MGIETGTNVIDITRDYYNSDDADNFYYHIWGGEDIHIGIYDNEDTPIFDASRRTVEKMASMLPAIDASTQILDVGAGYGGAARYLAETYGCRVTCLNLSEVENERNRKHNREQNLDTFITVIDGNFENLPFPDKHFDIVWSEDAILHSADRERVIQEVSRVLKKDGHFIFTDPMQKVDCPDGVLQPVYDRIHLENLADMEFYANAAEHAGMQKVEIVDMSEQLPYHYSRVAAEIEKNYESLSNVSSTEYLDRMLQGLQHWVNAGQKGFLKWGILYFKKAPESS